MKGCGCSGRVRPISPWLPCAWCWPASEPTTQASSQLREYADRAREGGAEAAAARDAYHARARSDTPVRRSRLRSRPAPVCFGADADTDPTSTGRSSRVAQRVRLRRFTDVSTSVDYPGGTFVVRAIGSTPRHRGYALDNESTSMADYATFADLRRGQNVDVSVYEVGGRLVAQTIRICTRSSSRASASSRSSPGGVIVTGNFPHATASAVCRIHSVRAQS